MRRAMLATLLLVVPGALEAQAPSTGSGVLLAVADCNAGDWCGHPTTYWIVREANRVRIAARGEGLLVPRRDGFWWMGALGGSNPFGEQYEEWPVCDTTQAADTTGAMADDPDALDDQTEGLIWARRAGASRDTTQYELTTWSNQATRIDWVSADWIAWSDLSIDNREHSHQSHSLVKFEALTRPSPDSVPGFEPDSTAWDRAERACLRRAFGAYADSAMTDPDALDPFGYSYWTVRRDRTRWRIGRIYYPSHGYDEGLTTCDVPAERTASMMGHDRVTIPWSAIKNVLPEAAAAFESPSGDLLLVQTDSVWHAFLPREGKIGASVASFQLGRNAIMAQWAVGAHAARWTREVSALMKAGPPAYVPKPEVPGGG
jgi:hypothetical protein